MENKNVNLRPEAIRETQIVSITPLVDDHEKRPFDWSSLQEESSTKDASLREETLAPTIGHISTNDLSTNLTETAVDKIDRLLEQKELQSKMALIDARLTPNYLHEEVNLD